MIYYLISSVSCALLLGAIGFFVFLKNPKQKTNRLFLLFNFFYALNAIGAASAYFIVDSRIAYFEFITLALLVVLSQASFLAFVQEFIQLTSKRNRILSRIHLIFGVSSSFIAYFLPYESKKVGFLWVLNPTPIAFATYLIFTITTFVFVFFLLWAGYQKHRFTLLAEQVKFFTLSVSIVFIAVLIDVIQQIVVSNFLPPNLGIPFTFNLTYLAAVIFATLIAYNIVKNKFLDIASALHHTLMWSALLILTFLPFSILGHFLSTLNFRTGFNRFSTFFILMVSAVLFFNWVKPRLDHFFYRRRYHLLKFLSEYHEKFSQISDLVTITNHVEHILMNTLYPKSFLLIADPTYFVDISGSLVIPILFDSKLLGYLILDNKRNERSYNATDRLFLKQLSNQLAIALYNINLLHQIELEKQEKLRLVERENLAKELTHFVSHEIKGPIYVIDGHGKKILKSFDQPKEVLKSSLFIVKECAKLSQFLNNYLLSETFSAGIETLEKNMTNLSEIISEVLSRNDIFLEEQGIQVQNHISNLQCSVDREKIHLVFNNLLLNSLKYSSKGSCIEISGYEQEDTVFLCFKDSGKGMTSEILNNVFKKFHASSSKKSHFVSSGLGLSICHKIICQHKGEIDIESQPNQGTTIKISLPKE